MISTFALASLLGYIDYEYGMTNVDNSLQNCDPLYGTNKSQHLILHPDQKGPHFKQGDVMLAASNTLSQLTD